MDEFVRLEVCRRVTPRLVLRWPWTKKTSESILVYHTPPDGTLVVELRPGHEIKLSDGRLLHTLYVQTEAGEPR